MPGLYAETLRQGTVTFGEIARSALAHAKVHKAATSCRRDAGRVEVLLAWFREYPAESITAQDIERQFVFRTVQELLGHKVIAMTVRHAHLAPQHALAAVQRLDGPTVGSSATTSDTGAFVQPVSELAVLH